LVLILFEKKDDVKRPTTSRQVAVSFGRGIIRLSAKKMNEEETG